MAQQTETIEREMDPEYIPHIDRADLGTHLPVSQAFVKEVGLDSGAQWRVLTETIYPGARTVEAVAMALTYCRVRNLDVFKRPVHIVPMWSSTLGKMVETLWPGIAELRTTAARTGEYAGIDEVVYGPEETIEFEGEMEKWVRVEGQAKKQKKLVKVAKKVTYPKWASVVIYRLVQGQRFAFHAKVFWREAYATIGDSDVPNEMWESRAFGQIDKCVEAAALRKAFPEEIGGEYAAEEMEGRRLPPTITGIVAANDDPPKPTEKASQTTQEAKGSDEPPKPSQAAKPAQQRQEPAAQQQAAQQKPAATKPQEKPAEKKPEPAKPASSELAGKQVEDAEVETNFDVDDGSYDEEEGESESAEDVEADGETDEHERVNPGAVLGRLEEAFGPMMTAEAIEEAWADADVHAVFTHLPDGDDWVAMAEAMKARHLRRVKNHGRR